MKIKLKINKTTKYINENYKKTLCVKNKVRNVYAP